MTRPDYCPIAGEPCQSMCEKPCSPNRGLLIDSEYASRLAFMLECLIVDYHGHWDAACKLLDEYKAEWEKINPSPPTFMGEPIPPERKHRLLASMAQRAAAPQPGDKPLEEPAQVAPEHQARVDQMATDAEARWEKERGILLEAANHLEGDGHFMPAEDADWAAGWIRRQIGAGATP